MKVLFDQNVPRKLVAALAKHEVTRSAQLGWEKLQNGDLLRAAEAADFVCLVTADRNLAYQQNLGMRRIAIVVLPSGNWPLVQTRLGEIVAAVDGAQSGSFVTLAPVYGVGRK